MKQKYIIAHGHRRYLAYTKLGYKKIPCLILPDRILEEIPLTHIDSIGNTRLGAKDGEIAQLMQSIKDNGLLHPIGVYRDGEVETEQFLIDNITENVQRENITPIELSNAITSLKKLGLTNKEIAVRLSMAPNKIDTLARMSAPLREKYIGKAAFYENSKSQKTGIPVSSLNLVSGFRLNAKDEDDLMHTIMKKSYGTEQIRVLGLLLRSGHSLKGAEQLLDSSRVVHARVAVDTEEWAKLKKRSEVSSDEELYNRILRKEVDYNPEIFLWLPKGRRRGRPPRTSS